MRFFNITLVLKMMASVGVHPKGHRSPIQLLLFAFNFFVFMSTGYLCALVYIYKQNLTLIEITDTLESLLLLFHGTLKLTATFLKHKDILNIIRQTKLFWEVEDVEDEKEKKDNLAILGYLKAIFLYFLGFATIPSIFFMFRPFILRQRILSFNSYIPDSIPYFMLFFLESYAFFLIYTACIAWDAFYATVIVLTYIQWRLLNNEIKRVLESKIDTEEDRKVVQKKVKKCIDHHSLLYKYTAEINDTSMSVVLLMFFAMTVLANCIEIFKISNKPSIGECLKSITYMISLTNEFVAFYCIPGQLLTSEAERTDTNSYCCKWYESASTYKKPIITMVSMMSRRKVYITAGKIINIGLETGLQTYKVVFSYYMFLRTMQNR